MRPRGRPFDSCGLRGPRADLQFPRKARISRVRDRCHRRVVPAVAKIGVDRGTPASLFPRNVRSCRSWVCPRCWHRGGPRIIEDVGIAPKRCLAMGAVFLVPQRGKVGNGNLLAAIPGHDDPIGNGDLRSGGIRGEKQLRGSPTFHGDSAPVKRRRICWNRRGELHRFCLLGLVIACVKNRGIPDAAADLVRRAIRG